MRKIIYYIFTIISLSGISNLHANIYNLGNMSADYIRTGNRNAATDAADIVIYNSGAITELPDGFQINMGNQTLIRKPEHSYNIGAGKETHGQDGIDWVVPNLFLTYNKDNWALFGGYYISGGGAVLNYPNGSITTDIMGSLVVSIFGGGYSNEYIKASSEYHTFTIGGAYKINDYISAALGMRYLSVENTMKGGITSSVVGELKEDIEEKATGYGAVAGVNINLTTELNLGIQYQSMVKLDHKISVNRDDMLLVIDGQKKRRDLPAVFGIGLGYDITDKFYTEINYTYYFQKNANWGKDDKGNSISDMAGDSQSGGITVSYKFLPGCLASAGVTYTDYKWNNMDGFYEASMGSYEVLYSDDWYIGCGIAYTLIDNIVLNLGYGKSIWEDADLTNSNLPGVRIKTKNGSTVLAVGLNVSF